MAQLHLLVVMDTDDGSFWVEGIDSAPVDSRESVFEDDEWRRPTDAEIDMLIEGEARLTALIEQEKR